MRNVISRAGSDFPGQRESEGLGDGVCLGERETLAIQSQPKSFRSPALVQTFIREAGDSLKLCGMVKMCRSGRGLARPVSTETF